MRNFGNSTRRYREANESGQPLAECCYGSYTYGSYHLIAQTEVDRGPTSSQKSGHRSAIDGAGIITDVRSIGPSSSSFSREGTRSSDGPGQNQARRADVACSGSAIEGQDDITPANRLGPGEIIWPWSCQCTYRLHSTMAMFRAGIVCNQGIYSSPSSHFERHSRRVLFQSLWYSLQPRLPHVALHLRCSARLRSEVKDYMYIPSTSLPTSAPLAPTRERFLPTPMPA